MLATCEELEVAIPTGKVRRVQGIVVQASSATLE